MYEYVLFDLDGTISDSSEGITKGIQIALDSYGIHEELSELRKFIGPPLKVSFHGFYGFDEEKTAEAIARYREYYSEIGLFQNTPYEGIEELLKKIKASGRKIAVATSKPEDFSNTILDKFGLKKYFDYIVGPSRDYRRGDKDEIILEAINRFDNPDKDNVVMIGDTKFDAEGAKTVGIDCIGVLYGFGKREELEAAGAKYIAETIEDIYQYL